MRPQELIKRDVRVRDGEVCSCPVHRSSPSSLLSHHLNHSANPRRSSYVTFLANLTTVCMNADKWDQVSVIYALHRAVLADRPGGGPISGAPKDQTALQPNFYGRDIGVGGYARAALDWWSRCRPTLAGRAEVSRGGRAAWAGLVIRACPLRGAPHEAATWVRRCRGRRAAPHGACRGIGLP